MKIYDESILIPYGQTLNIKYIQLQKFDAPYHQHPEYELTLIIRGYGTRYIGGQKEPFQPGDFVLLGSKIPHAWITDNNCKIAEAIVIQWHNNKIARILSNVPEWQVLESLIERAQLGLHFSEIQSILHKLFELYKAPLRLRLVRFLEILCILSDHSENSKQILTHRFIHTSRKDCRRMAQVLEYISENVFNDEISVTTISRILYMTPSAFCHFFKKRTNKTFIEYINEIKLSKSTQLLIDSDEKISVIAFQSGFKNLSNFNRLFIKKYGSSPSNYRNQSKSAMIPNETNPK
ncbi:AraC family transcriptional regulator [Membranihabitans maritimus]|uniref:AraC family transcriptional regulator n=1 Tax=Membranihabitans maritimus TaxID=2904244 RepID=UPI001F283ACD